MRFRFCGGDDCPDWLLAEINSLSKFSSIKIRTLTSKLVDFEVENERKDIDDEDEALQAASASLTFILRSAAKFETDAGALQSELQQLGLPKEHSIAIGRVYGENKLKLSKALRRRSLRTSRLNSCKFTNVSDDLEGVITFEFDSSLSSSSNNNNAVVSMSSKTFHTLLRDMRSVKAMINEL